MRIEKLVPGGDGLGHLEGKVVFVPLTAPGDLVALKEIRRRRGVLFAEPDEIIKASSLRRKPPCPWYGSCGGCQWMHMDYPSQIRWKEEIFMQAMRGIGHLKERPSIKFHSAPSEFHYRFRAKLQINVGMVGFYRRASKRIVTWERCMLLPEAINSTVKDLRQWITGNFEVESLNACEIALSPVDLSVTLCWIFSGEKENREPAQRIMDGVEETTAGGKYEIVGQVARSLKGAVIAARGGSLPLEVDGTSMSASPGTFFQVNPDVNAVLLKRTLNHLRSAGSATLLDLYCGNGNFSLTSAAAGLQVVGVDSTPGAVRDARSASVRDGRFIEMDTTRFLERDNERYDAVIVDPPRTGLPREVSRLLVSKGVPLLIYVSCDPSTLARDLARFTKAGYAVSEVELFDMFPQTSHLEALVVMKR